MEEQSSQNNNTSSDCLRIPTVAENRGLVLCIINCLVSGLTVYCSS